MFKSRTFHEMSECPFAIRRSYLSNSDERGINDDNEFHNHQYVKSCRLTNSEKITAHELSANGVPVAAIQTTLQTAHGNTHSSRKLINNEVAKACDEFLGGLYEVLRVLSNDSGEV